MLEDLKCEAWAYEVGSKAARAMDQTNAKISKADARSSKKRPKSQHSTNCSRSGKPNQLKGMCHRCGSREHISKSCDKKKEDLVCNFCKKQGHLERVCHAKVKSQTQSSTTASHLQSCAASPETDDDAFTSHVHCCGLNAANRPTPKIQLELSTVTKPIKTFDFAATPDTGATRSVMARNILKQYNIKFSESNSRLFAANRE
jgi:hypothetical protein